MKEDTLSKALNWWYNLDWKIRVSYREAYHMDVMPHHLIQKLFNQ